MNQSFETKYLVIGRDTRGKKFRLVYSDIRWALGINLWDGRVWEVSNGKRKLIKEV
jgi:hypothetical protein